MPRKLNKVFINHPLDPRGGDSNPPGPLRPLGPPKYFGLQMVNLGMPPLPPNRPYHWPINYPKCVKDFDPNVHVNVTTLALGLQPRQRLAKVWAKSEPKSYISCSWECERM
jgi:hypothetical protein